MHKYNWNKEHLEETVRHANCWFVWLDLLKIPRAGCNYKTLKRKANEFKIDTSHFNYIYARTHNGFNSSKNIPFESLFKKNSKHDKPIIKKEYIRRILNGNEYCEICGIKNWMGKQIVFQLHHKDGNNKNNELKNLQLVCPNCHSQTENYSNRKRE